MYFIRKIKYDNMLPEYPDFEVYVDSPLAIEATNIFHRNVESCFDEEAMELIRQGINPLSFPGLKTSVTSDESKAINFNLEPKVIISASGMCEAGRIRHHLKHNLWRRECTILFVGYQAHGTLGRSILEGASSVKLFGEEIEVCARIEKLDGISGHADQKGLLRWLHSFESNPKVFVVHGEDLVCEGFKKLIQDEGYEAVAPFSGAEFDLVANQLIFEGVQTKKVKISQKAFRAQTIFDRLVAAGNRLLTVIAHNRGGANKDLIKFTDQINSLCDKWDR